MDIPAVKPESVVAAGSAGKGSSMSARHGKDLPPPPAGIDPVVVQDSREQRAALARQINSYLHSSSRELDFQVDAESGDVVMTVRDAEGNVVRRIPGEDALEMLRRLSVDPGTLVDSLV